MPLLFSVDNVHAIEERGVIAIGKLVDPETARYRIGDRIEVHRNGRVVVETEISGIPMGMAQNGVAEILLRGVAPADIEPGDDVWSSTATA